MRRLIFSLREGTATSPARRRAASFCPTCNSTAFGIHSIFCSTLLQRDKMYIQIFLALSSLVMTWTLWSWYCLYQNYRIACKIGIPIRIIPISHENPLWMAVDKRFFIPLFQRVPFGTGTFTRFNWRGWEFADKYKSHMEMGDVFMIVTPGRNWLYVCDPQALADIFQRRSDFPRPLEIFGNP